MTDHTYDGAEHVVLSTASLTSDLGFAIPADRMRIARMVPDAGGDAQCVVTIGQYIGRRGIYLALTPEGARAMAASLLEQAENADQHNAQHAAAMLARTLRGGGQA